MPAFGLDTILGAMGTPDPDQEFKDYQARQTAANAAAIDPNNPAAPPPDPNAAAAAANTLPPGQTPQATKTPQDMGSILLDLQRRQQAQQGWNQAMGMGVAAFAQPRDREMVSKMFNEAPIDFTKFGQTVMDLNSQQQGQNRMNQLGALIHGPQGADIAKSLNIPLPDLIAQYDANPQGVGDMIRNFRQPTDQLKNLQQIQDLQNAQAAVKAAGGTDQDLNDVATVIKGGVAGQDAAPMVLAQAAWRKSHPNQPMPWTPNDNASYKQYTANEAAKETDRQTASTELVDKNESAQTLQGDLSELKDSPGLKSIMTTPGKRDVALKALNDGTVTDIPSMMSRWGLSNDEAKAVALLRRIGGATTETAMRGMAGTGTRVTQSEVGPLKDAVSMTQNLNQSYEDYIHGAVNNAVTKTKRAVAANYGNTGNVKNMPAEYAPWLNDAFKKGGQLYKEGSGADDLPGAQPVPDSEIAQGKTLLKDKPYLKQEMLDNWQQRGLDTSKLRSTSPSGW
jgi:hypothetical protein